ncbi:MAG: GxxExxY protein [Gammaproteobacteria bacterium]
MIETADYSLSADQVIPHILRRANDVERIITLVVTQAEYTRELLGNGVPSNVHQLVLVNRLIHMGLPVNAEPTLSTIDDEAGRARTVIAVCDRLLIECHAETEHRQLYRRRLKQDLDNSRYETGLLISFDSASSNGAVTRVMSGQLLH